MVINHHKKSTSLFFILYNIFMGRKQKKIEQIESIVNEEANKNYVPVILTMNKIIAAVKEELVNFVPSVGTKTLADIDSRAKELIKKIQNSKEFAELMKDKERKTELKEPVLLLSRTRATR